MQQLKQAIAESPPPKIEESAQPSNEGQGITGHDRAGMAGRQAVN